MLNHTTAEKFEVTKLRSNSTVKKSCLHGFGGIRKFWDRHIGIHVSSFFLLSSISVKLPVKLGCEAPNSKVVKLPDGPPCSSNLSNVINVPTAARIRNGDECRLLDFGSSDRPLVVNFGSAT
ncbi:hypothetical protein F2P81_003897 [Scophthalmus maximus]|uniref:Iodothyronine deiodinase n=1 Tax=Scophthalmus maximus TaxID=52904 RepID=A0A6A4TIQ3_SCOMX|nr:hypothetical protein F2P81_003897 [Scophthalmus maximus]